MDYKDRVKYISIHAPSDLTIAHTDYSHREFATDCVERLIRVAPEIDCNRVVVHGFYNVTKISNRRVLASLRKAAFQRCVDSFKRLDNVARDFGVKVCLENINARVHLDQLYYAIFGASPYDLAEIAAKVNSPLFKLCFDAAHAHNFCKLIHESPEMQALYRIQTLSIPDFFNIISNNVSIIHLSDATGSVAGFRETEHLPLQEGEIDFRLLLKAILEYGFNGPIVLETQEREINNAVNMLKGRRTLYSLMNLSFSSIY